LEETERERERGRRREGHLACVTRNSSLKKKLERKKGDAAKREPFAWKKNVWVAEGPDFGKRGRGVRKKKKGVTFSRDSIIIFM